MGSLRTVSTRKLVALCIAALAMVAGLATVAGAAIGGGGTPPPPSTLADALHSAANAQRVDGVTARIDLTSHLFDAAGVENVPALIKGGSGRLWVAPGKLRVEVAGDSGDSQIVVNDGKGYVYDHSANLAYTFDFSKHATDPSASEPAHQGPTLAEIQRKIAEARGHAVIGDPASEVIGGQGAYSVRIVPRDSGGLLGAAEAAWDAARGVPLRLALYARGSSTPALQLEARDIAYGAVDPAIFDLTPPPGATVHDVTGAKPAAADPAGTDKKEATNASLADLPFALNDPPAVAGRDRASAEPVGDGGALVTYGKGLDSVLVFERKAEAKDTSTAPADHGGQAPLELPTIKVNGADATLVSTPLGGILTFQRGGISYTIAGSQPAGVLEAAARDL